MVIGGCRRCARHVLQYVWAILILFDGTIPHRAYVTLDLSRLPPPPWRPHPLGRPRRVLCHLNIWQWYGCDCLMYIGNLHLHRNLYLRICNCAHGQYSKYIYVVICIVTFEHDTSSRAEIFAFRFPNGWPLVPLSCGCPHMRVGCDIQCGGCCCIMHVRDMVLAAREFAFNYVQVMWIDCVCAGHAAAEGAHAHMVGQCVMPLAAALLPSPPRRFPLRAVGFQPVPTASRWLILVAGASTRYDIW